MAPWKGGAGWTRLFSQVQESALHPRIRRSGRSPGEGNGNPLQYSCLKNPMDRDAQQAGWEGLGRRMCRPGPA